MRTARDIKRSTNFHRRFFSPSPSHASAGHQGQLGNVHCGQPQGQGRYLQSKAKGQLHTLPGQPDSRMPRSCAFLSGMRQQERRPSDSAARLRFKNTAGGGGLYGASAGYGSVRGEKRVADFEMIEPCAERPILDHGHVQLCYYASICSYYRRHFDVHVRYIMIIV